MRRILVAALIAASLTAPSSLAAQESSSRSNILVIVTDDQRRATAKHLAGATWFPNWFTPTPLCCPSRTSIMTGQYAHNHGIKDNVPTGHRVEFGAPTIQGKLDSAGYRTGTFGKFLNKWPITANPPNFDEWALTGGGFYGSTWNLNGEIVTKEEYTTSIISDKADAFIQPSADPWYAYVTPYAPHDPYTPEAKYADAAVSPWSGNPATREARKSDKPPHVRDFRTSTEVARYTRRQQIRSLKSVYDMRARLIATLKATGQYDNTVIVSTSDNGYLWGEHGLLHKGAPYDPATRVGASVRIPGRFVGGIDSRYAATIDILPTVMQAAGVKFDPTRVDGRALQFNVRRSSMLLEYWANTASRRPWAALKTHRFQYTEWYRSGRVVFKEYYRASDPWQLRNVVDKLSKTRRAALHSRLKSARNCAGVGCRNL